MGQKANPISTRLGINQKWSSTWFPKKGQYAANLKLDLAIRKYLESQFKGKSVSSIYIQNNGGLLTIDIHAAKPGLIIGQQGSKIDELKSNLERKFKTNFVINVVEIPKPALDAKIVAESIAQQIERRISYRRACKAAIEKAMDSGAKGIKVKVGGRLNGVDIARSEFFTKGRVPLQTLRADISYADERADTTYGVIGVKVWIYRGEVFN
ncbi:30S ribosomal protein S3 [bacterium]|nr:30S ribosomal protein S3 [bacterium]|tara:strand:+ start:376 stop:1005 length:630 start_codon:yes stop_codon:yes gene_type:complete